MRLLVYLILLSIGVCWAILDPVHLPLLSHKVLPHIHLRSDVSRIKSIQRYLSPDALPPFDSPLGGSVWPTGGFFGQISVGTPLQAQLVQIDTGSSDLLIAEVGCSGCPAGPSWDPSASSTAEQIACGDPAFYCTTCANGTLRECYYKKTYQTCDYSNPTASCSLIGPTYLDAFSLGGGTNVPKVGFGGITLHTGAFDNEWTNMPGVLGLAYASLATVWLYDTVFDAVVRAGQLNNLFGLCLGPNGGHLTLGGINSSLYIGDISYTPIITKTFFVVGIADFGVNQVSLGLNPNIFNNASASTIVDSGTYNLVIPGEAYDALAVSFIEMCSTTPLAGICNVNANETFFSGSCYSLTNEQIEAFPNVTFWLDQIERPFSIQGRDYLLLTEQPSTYCFGIQSSGIGGFTALGNVFQQPFYIVFDRENSQVGFADVSPNCSRGDL